MEITRTLIEKFLQNQCTAEEADAVREYLLQHPEELEAWLPEQDWEAFEPADRLHPAYSRQMLDRIQEAAGRQRRHAFPFRRIAAVAAAVLLLAAGWWWYRQPANDRRTPAVVADNRKAYTPRDTLVQNTGNSNRHIVLPDGSKVVLERRSSLQWTPGFTPSQRALRLKGAATFTVARDQQRPFVIYTGNVVTTALGTSFRVSAHEGANAINVKLLTGKVSVKALDAPAGKDLVYLQPGQECTFRKKARTLTVQEPAPEAQPAAIPPVPAKGSIAENGNELLFTNVPLPEVLEKFKSVYGKEISYSERQLRKYYFTGQVSRSDALINILNTIAELNTLKVTQDSTGYHIHK